MSPSRPNTIAPNGRTAKPAAKASNAKMKALVYGSALEAIAEKYHSSPALMQQLNPGKSFAAGESIVAPYVAAEAALPEAAKVVVDKSDSTVSLVDAGGRKFAQFPATTGSEHDPLPIGDWKIQGVSKNPEFHYNPDLFWDAKSGHSKATIAAGPNNPVGVAWIDLSKEHYGIHGTPEQVREQLEELVAAGANHLLLNPISRHAEQLEAVAQLAGLK